MRVWGESIRYVLKKNGVGVSVICPGFVGQPHHRQRALPDAVPDDRRERASAIIRRGLARNQARIAFPDRHEGRRLARRPAAGAGRKALGRD